MVTTHISQSGPLGETRFSLPAHCWGVPDFWGEVREQGYLAYFLGLLPILLKMSGPEGETRFSLPVSSLWEGGVLGNCWIYHKVHSYNDWTWA